MPSLSSQVRDSSTLWSPLRVSLGHRPRVACSRRISKGVRLMAQDNVPTFVAGPAAFIAQHPIALNWIGQNMPGGNFPVVNNQRTRFTLTTATVAGLPAPNEFPSLRMQPAGGPATVPVAGGGVVTTLDAYYAHAGNGGMPVNTLPHCDIPIAPTPLDAHLVFTTGMNGCSFVLASAVPPAAPPLAAGHWRILHDHDHHTLAAWVAAGYTVHFASYVDLAQPGVWPPPPSRSTTIPTVIHGATPIRRTVPSCESSPTSSGGTARTGPSIAATTTRRAPRC